MNVRVVQGKEKRRLRPSYHPWAGPNRVLDHGEQTQVVHLYRTRQATPDDLALRFGISKRTVFRYLNRYPTPTEHDAAARRVRVEAQRCGLTLTDVECLRLAVAALLADRAA